MPLYEYQCERCNATFEVLLRGAEQRVKCEKCGSRRVKKLLSAFSAGTSSCGTAGVT